jgi:hypothetical protein
MRNRAAKKIDESKTSDGKRQGRARWERANAWANDDGGAGLMGSKRSGGNDGRECDGRARIDGSAENGIPAGLMGSRGAGK